MEDWSYLVKVVLCSFSNIHTNQPANGIYNDYYKAQ